LKKYYYSYNEFLEDIKILSKDIKKFNPQAIVAVARGGVSAAHFIANALDNRNLFTINSVHYNNQKKLDYIKVFNIPNLNGFKRILIVDDIIDSGDTIKEVLNRLKSNYKDIDFKVATLFYKKSAKFKPDYFAKEAKAWIDFFWEVDFKI
jgi:xanthine phosphoribosyltransferase